MDCPLNSMDLPATGEANHQIGDCHCYLCTCGEHKCPSNLEYKRSFPQNTYSSIYQKDFLKKKHTNLLRYVREGELFLSSQKMDLQTTQRSTFRSHSGIYTREPSQQAPLNINYKLYTSSTYQANYPDWKNYLTFDYSLKNNYSGSPLKFTAESTYGKDFKEFSPQVAKKATEFPRPSLIGCSQSKTGETTSQLTYKHHKNGYHQKSRSQSRNEYVPLENVAMVSTYQKNFLPFVSRDRIPTKKQTIFMKSKDN